MAKNSKRPGNRKRRDRKPRTIGTNVGQLIREAQAAAVEAKRAEQAAIMRKMAGES